MLSNCCPVLVLGPRAAGPRWTFVDRFEALGSAVRQEAAGGGGPQHFERFQYWNESWHYWRSIAALECTWQQYEDAAATVRSLPTAAGRQQAAKHTLLPLRIRLVAAAETTVTAQLQLLSDPGRSHCNPIQNLLYWLSPRLTGRGLCFSWSSQATSAR